jgi:hypothetical protein
VPGTEFLARYTRVADHRFKLAERQKLDRDSGRLFPRGYLGANFWKLDDSHEVTSGCVPLFRGWGVLASVAVLLMTGCGPGSSSPAPNVVLRHYLGSPPGVGIMAGPGGRGPLDAAVWADGDQIAVVTWGSSGCPRLPNRVNVAQKNTIEVTIGELHPPPGVACPMDSTPTTSIIAVPQGINPAQQVDVRFVDVDTGTTVSLPPRK